MRHTHTHTHTHRTHTGTHTTTHTHRERWRQRDRGAETQRGREREGERGRDRGKEKVREVMNQVPQGCIRSCRELKAAWTEGVAPEHRRRQRKMWPAQSRYRCRSPGQ